MDIGKYLLRRKKIIDSKLLSFLPKGGAYTKKLHDAAGYSLTTGGKRIRPIFVLAACEAVSGRYKAAIPMACAVEMIHTYTLIHDDLPAMDDDDFRRGKPTCHRVFGEDVAILAGDMLNVLAFETIAKHYDTAAGRLVLELSNSLGMNGVVGGQAADIASAGRKVALKELRFISTCKTAYLFIASVRCGAMVGGASVIELERLTSYARHVGLAFQIIDDILDFRQGDRNNYPAVLGVKGAKKAAEKELKAALSSLPETRSYGILRRIALHLSERKD